MTHKVPCSTPVSSLLCLCLVAVGCRADTAQTQLPTPSRELQVPGSGSLATFDNGLTLFVVPDAYTRLVQFDVRQQVGSREDPEGKGGMAHFVEHLMFQMPVDGPDSAKLMSDITRHTLTFNAYTATDHTHYMHTGTAKELETYMKYTALRLNYDCSAVDENNFFREREVVRNEHRWRGQDIDLLVFDKVAELAFPEGHPYRRPMLDGDKDVAAISPGDACEFIQRYYNPGQASVVVTGDVDPLEVLALAKKYLEPLPARTVAPRKAVAPANFEPRTEEIKAPVRKPTAMLVYKMPKRFTRDYAAASAAIETLALSIMFFVQTKNARSTVVKNWYFVPLGGEEAPLMGIAVETKRAADLDRALDEVTNAITRGFAPSLKGDEHRGSYDSARQRARLQVLDSVAEILSRSDAYAAYLEVPNSGFLGAELAALDNLTAQRAQQVGRKLFAPSEALIVKVVPDGSKDKPKAEQANFKYTPKDDENLAVPDDIDPAEAHQPLELGDIAPAEGQSMQLTLENGMNVLLVQSSDMPVMDVQLIVGAGTEDVADRGVIAELVSRYYGPGDSLEANNIRQMFDMAGGIFGSDVGPTSTTYYSRGLAVSLDYVLVGLADAVVQSEYRTSALEEWKAARKDELKKASVRQAAQRKNEFNIALYGKGHPHAHEVLADWDGVRSIKLRDLENFHDTHYRAANSTLVITGGFDMDMALKYVEAYFGQPVLRDSKSTWLAPKATAPRKPAPPPQPGNVRHITQVDKRRVQTDMTIGFPLATAYGPDHAALAVLAEMLTFRVSAVRMKLGASYGVYAALGRDQPGIRVGGALDSNRAGEASKAIYAAIEQVRSGEDFDRQFAFARRQVLSSLINVQADAKRLAEQLAEAVRHGYSYDYFQELTRKVAALTPEAVKAQIDTVLQPGRSVTLIEGPAEGVQGVLEANGIQNPKVLPEVIHDEDD